MWKKYQDFQQKNILTPKAEWGDRFIDKMEIFEQNLAAYHWKNHIIVTEESGGGKEPESKGSDK